MEFIYRDAQGQISARSISDVSESAEYLQGICRTRGALRTFRKDRILEHLADDLERGQVEVRLAAHRSANPSSSGRDSQARTVEVCFTGFNASEKADLIQAAESAMFRVRSGVTKGLQFLCCGANAGPSKVRKAREQGVIVLTAEEFRSLAQTGEVPDEE